MHEIRGELSAEVKNKIVCVDDDMTQLKIYKHILGDINCNLELINDPEIALEKMLSSSPDLVLLDINMPKVDGFEILSKLKETVRGRDISVVMVSSSVDYQTIQSAFEKGAVDYIRKPFFKNELQMRVKLQLENICLKKANRSRFQKLESVVLEKVEEIQNIKNTTIFSLAKIAESRDPETGKHLERIREYVKLVAEDLSQRPGFHEQINEEYIFNIYHMSVLHDIGKVGIPDNILLKPGKLNDDEFAIMKTHTLIGGKALDETIKKNKNSTFLDMGRDIAYYHHERWNGNGYPFGLKGNEIPLAARITAIADVFDAISFRRVYRNEAMTQDEIERVLREEAGSLIDPAIYQVFLSRKDDFYQIKHDLAE